MRLTHRLTRHPWRAGMVVAGWACLVTVAGARGEQRQQPARAGRLAVLVVKTSDNPLYSRGAENILNGLKSRCYRSSEPRALDVSTVSLVGNEDADRRTIRDHVAKKPDLILSLGTDATRLIQSASPACPTVFSLILDPVQLGVAKSLDAPGGLFTGTTLVVNAGKQLEAFVQSVPERLKHGRIGLLYTDHDPTSLRFIEEAREAAAQLKVEIAAQPVPPMGRDTRAALAALGGKVDAIWLIPDPASTGGTAFAETIEFAKEKRLPVIGASSAMAERGALLALSADLSDLSDLTAEIAARILDGTATPGATRIRGPRKTILSINLQVARRLSLSIPDSVLHLADQVYDGMDGTDGTDGTDRTDGTGGTHRTSGMRE